MQLLLLHMLHQRPARAVDDTFRRAGGAGGIQDVERVIKGQLREFQLRRLACAEQIIKPAAVRRQRLRRG